MEYDLSPETNELRDMVRTFLQRRAPEESVRATIAGQEGRDPALWRQMAEQIGLQGLLVPESLGGQGTTLVEACVVLEEMGRAATPSPYLSSSVVAATALTSLSAASTDKLLQSIAEGVAVATLAFQDEKAGLGRSSVHAVPTDGDAWALSGSVDLVLDAQQADVLLVAATTPDGLGLFEIANPSAGLTIETLGTLDLTRPAASVHLDGALATRHGDDFTEAQSRAVLVARAAVAAEMAGALQKLLELAVDYAKIREQFGRPIGTFQAVKHLCSDIYVTAESAVAVTRKAVRSVVDGEEDAALQVAVAQAYLSDEGPTAAEKALQVHGGIGFTWEHPVHLYLRKVKSGAMLFGAAPRQREDVAHLLGLEA